MYCGHKGTRMIGIYKWNGYEIRVSDTIIMHLYTKENKSVVVFWDSSSYSTPGYMPQLLEDVVHRFSRAGDRQYNKKICKVTFFQLIFGQRILKDQTNVFFQFWTLKVILHPYQFPLRATIEGLSSSEPMAVHQNSDVGNNLSVGITCVMSCLHD